MHAERTAAATAGLARAPQRLAVPGERALRPASRLMCVTCRGALKRLRMRGVGARRGQHPSQSLVQRKWRAAAARSAPVAPEGSRWRGAAAGGPGSGGVLQRGGRAGRGARLNTRPPLVRRTMQQARGLDLGRQLAADAPASPALQPPRAGPPGRRAAFCAAARGGSCRSRPPAAGAAAAAPPRSPSILASQPRHTAAPPPLTPPHHAAAASHPLAAHTHTHALARRM